MWSSLVRRAAAMRPAVGALSRRSVVRANATTVIRSLHSACRLRSAHDNPLAPPSSSAPAVRPSSSAHQQHAASPFHAESEADAAMHRDQAAATLCERALFAVRLERSFFACPPEDRDAPTVLALLNRIGFHQRVIDTYKQRLTDEEANDPAVIAQYWTAERSLPEEQRESAMGQSNAAATDSFSHAASASSSSSHSSSTALLQSAAPSYASSPAPHPSTVPSPSPSGVLYISRFGKDPSRLKEYMYSEARESIRRQDVRSRWIALGALLFGAFGASAIASYTMTDEQREQVLEQSEQAKEQLIALIRGGGIAASAPKVPAERPKTRISDVHGCDEAKAEVIEVIEYLKDPSRFNRLGGKMPKGVLLLGPPGTGKTLLARAIAGEAGVPFFAATGADFEEMYQGVGSKRIRELFAEAKKVKPSIIFIDEIDSIGGKRNDMDSISTRTSLNQLLTELDGFQGMNGVIVIAATNFAKKLDPALLRPGRFDRHVTVGVPDIKGRQALLTAYAAKLKLDPRVDLSQLAGATAGMTGADLSHLVNTAALHAASQDAPMVTLDDLEYAKDHIVMGAARTTAVNSPELKRQISVYESGKTLVALLTPHARPLHKVTIMQRGSQLGRTSQSASQEGTDVTSQSYEEMLAALDCRMGGRVAEELIYGSEAVSSNGARDLAAANQLARAMVMQLGFGVNHGPVADADVKRFGTSASPEAKESVDQEVRQLLGDAYERAKRLLQTHDLELQRLAEALQHHETLDAQQVERARKGRLPKERASD